MKFKMSSNFHQTLNVYIKKNVVAVMARLNYYKEAF